MGRSRQYNTLSDDDTIQYSGGYRSRWGKKEKRRKCCSYITAGIILFTLMGAVVAVALVVVKETTEIAKCSLDPSDRFNCIPEG